MWPTYPETLPRVVRVFVLCWACTWEGEFTANLSRTKQEVDSAS